MSSSYYDNNAEQFISTTLNVDMDEFYHAFSSNLKKASKILDAGCGSGRDSLFFLKHGFNVDAFDLSAEMVKHATRLTGINVKRCGFDDININNKYDGIWCCASLLHVPKSKLPTTMQLLANALKDNGIWYVSFKYGDEERQINGRSFSDLNEAALFDIVKNLSKIEIDTIWITQDKRPGRDEKWLNALLRKVP